MSKDPVIKTYFDQKQESKQYSTEKPILKPQPADPESFVYQKTDDKKAFAVGLTTIIIIALIVILWIVF